MPVVSMIYIWLLPIKLHTSPVIILGHHRTFTFFRHRTFLDHGWPQAAPWLASWVGYGSSPGELRNFQGTLCAAQPLTFNEPRPGPSKSSATKKIAFRLHGALLFSVLFFLNSRQGPFLRLTSRRHGSAFVIWVFSGRPALAAGGPQILCWPIPAQGVFLGEPKSPKLSVFTILLTFFRFRREMDRINRFVKGK